MNAKVTGERMRDGMENEAIPLHYREYFNIAYVIKGETSILEKIKTEIITKFVLEGAFKLIKPTYSKSPILIRDSNKCETEKAEECRPLLNEGDCKPDEYYLAFILRGETKYLEEAKKIIEDFSQQGLIKSAHSAHALDRIFIVTNKT